MSHARKKHKLIHLKVIVETWWYCETTLWRRKKRMMYL